MKLVKTLQSKLAVSSAATTALAADQGTQHRQRAALFFFSAAIQFCFVFGHLSRSAACCVARQIERAGEGAAGQQGLCREQAK